MNSCSTSGRVQVHTMCLSLSHIAFPKKEYKTKNRYCIKDREKSLLETCSMGQLNVSEEETVKFSVATEFNVKVHKEFFEEVLKFFAVAS